MAAKVNVDETYSVSTCHQLISPIFIVCRYFITFILFTMFTINTKDWEIQKVPLQVFAKCELDTYLTLVS
jgi:hypothetical protein